MKLGGHCLQTFGVHMINCFVYFCDEPEKPRQLVFRATPRIGEKVKIGETIWYCHDVIHNTRFDAVEIFLEHTK